MHSLVFILDQCTLTRVPGTSSGCLTTCTCLQVFLITFSATEVTDSANMVGNSFRYVLSPAAEKRYQLAQFSVWRRTGSRWTNWLPFSVWNAAIMEWIARSSACETMTVSWFFSECTLSHLSQMLSPSVWFQRTSFLGIGRTCAFSCILQNTKYSWTSCTIPKQMAMTMTLLQLCQPLLLRQKRHCIAMQHLLLLVWPSVLFICHSPASVHLTLLQGRELETDRLRKAQWNQHYQLPAQLEGTRHATSVRKEYFNSHGLWNARCTYITGNK